MDHLLAIAIEVIFGDEEEEEARARPRVIRERVPHFVLDDKDFPKRFRLTKESVETVLGFIGPQLRFRTEKNHAVSPMNQLLLTLRFYATGCTQLAAADFSGVSESTACRIVHRVSDALALLYPDFIRMPQGNDIRQIQRQFYRIAKFPRVVGAVDGTHVKIRSPGGDDAEYYRNRKGYFSINVQAVCSADLQFTNIVARWPGSTHDQTIFDHSRLRSEFENGLYGDAVLVGDSAYASRSYMMTPLDRPTSRAEELYNESQIRTRNPIERIFGVWKRRFPAMAIGPNIRLDRVQAVIIATAVLFNILRRAHDPLPPDDPTVHNLPWAELLSTGNMESTGTSIVRRAPHRTQLIQRYFSRLS